jgi:hypothetical protein
MFHSDWQEVNRHTATALLMNELDFSGSFVIGFVIRPTTLGLSMPNIKN